MIRFVSLTVLLALTGVITGAEPPPPIKLTLQPMAEPVPALKYYLLPEVRDQNPDNAAQLYYRAFNPEWYSAINRDPKRFARLNALFGKPLRDITRAELAEFSWLKNWKALEEVDRAARRPYCDWELTERMREEGVNLQIADLQSLRTFAGLLRLRVKMELLDGKFDKAVRTIQTGLSMGQHVTNGPTLIQGLIGAACASLMLEAVEDWINLPDSPNLYWALTNLPHPLLDFQVCFKSERLWLDAILPGYREMLADSSTTPPSAEQLQKNLKLWAALLNDGKADISSSLTTLVLVLKDYPEAKRFLKERGYTSKQVEAMPVLHAVFLYETYMYDTNYDNLRKWVNFSYPVAISHTVREQGKISASRSRPGGNLSSMLTPFMSNVLKSPVRIERKIAALCCVEAIRLHASAKGGRLPENLTEVTEVPIPIDPYTGKAFQYHRTGNTATLTGPAAANEESSMFNTISYELTIRAGKDKK